MKNILFALLFLNQSHAQDALPISFIGGEAGNGGYGPTAQVQGILARAITEVVKICQNFPEYSGHVACKQVSTVSQALSHISWIPAEQTFLCLNQKVFFGDLKDFAKDLVANAPCTERDAINFGKQKNAKGQFGIVVNESRYQFYLKNKFVFASIYVQNLIHEVLGVLELEKSDSYVYSNAWLQFIQKHSRLLRVVDEVSDPEVSPLWIESDFSEDIQNQFFEVLAKLGYAKSKTKEHSLYQFKMSLNPVSEVLSDRSRDFEVTISFERLSDLGFQKTLKTESFKYNSRGSSNFIPVDELKRIFLWIRSGGIPRAMK